MNHCIPSIPPMCTSPRTGYLNHCVQIHINRPYWAIRYLLNSRCMIILMKVFRWVHVPTHLCSGSTLSVFLMLVWKSIKSSLMTCLSDISWPYFCFKNFTNLSKACILFFLVDTLMFLYCNSASQPAWHFRVKNWLHISYHIAVIHQLLLPTFFQRMGPFQSEHLMHCRIYLLFLS